MDKDAKPIGLKQLVVGIIVAVIVITILFIPMIPVKEAYNESEEYERKAGYEVVSATLKVNASIVIVNNIDAYGGTFMVTHHLYDVNGLYGTKTAGEYLAAGQNKTFRAEFDTTGLQDVHSGYSVLAPTVIDRRVVTRHKTVYKSVIEILVYG